MFARCARIAVLAASLAMSLAPAFADTTCREGEPFAAWLANLREEAGRAGISATTLAALDELTFDERVLKQDRGQPTLSQSFLDFAGRVVSADRLARGRALLKTHAEMFARIERDYGVPGAVITAFWGLETDYGAFMGNFSSLRSLATLAYDCRRPDHFRAELIDALRLVESGDLEPREMTGAWAGELGQVQFTSSNYVSTRSTTTATASVTWSAACPTRSPPPPITCKRSGGGQANPGWKKCGSPTACRGRRRRAPT